MKLTGILTVLCIIWIIVVYVFISIEIGDLLKSNDDSASGIWIVIACAGTVTFGIFPFPFCKEVSMRVIESYGCWNVGYPIKKPYSETFGVQEEMRANLITTNDTDTDWMTDQDAEYDTLNTVMQEEQYKL